MPKLPPPPRRPKYRSGCSSAVARIVSPSAVTTVYDTTLSQAMPNCRASQPMPPPSVKPPTPVCPTLPAVVARPWCSAARSRLRSSEPPWTCARRRSGSIRTTFIGLRSIISPPSGTDSPTMLWPPHFTATSSPASRAWRTAAATSSAEVQRAITRGRRSTIAFQTSRCSSKVGSPGSTTSPANPGIVIGLPMLPSSWRLVVPTTNQRVGLDSAGSFIGGYPRRHGCQLRRTARPARPLRACRRHDRDSVERKGATMPYTSRNGHMFSFLDPGGSMALRLSADDRDAFLSRYQQHARGAARPGDAGVRGRAR